MIIELFFLAGVLCLLIWIGLTRPTFPIWIAAIGLSIVFYLVIQTNGVPGDFFAPTETSKIYPNLWDHVLRGDFGIDRKFAAGEYFAAGPDYYTVYFGIMPAMLRGLANALGVNTYITNLTGLSMLAAISLAASSLVYALRTLCQKRRRNLKRVLPLVVAFLFASPISYLNAWGWVYHETIIWGVAWCAVFVSFFSLWIFSPSKRRAWHGVAMGGAVGMALLARPSVALTALVPFGFLLCRSVWFYFRRKLEAELRLLLPGVLIALFLFGLTFFVNYQRWGSPFRFWQIEEHVVFIQNQQRVRDLKASGEYSLSRLVPSFKYYVLPTLDNVQRNWPFITPDQQLKLIQHAPYYDYIEGARIPIVVSMPYLLVAAVLGAIKLRELKPDERVASFALLTGGAMTTLVLLTIFTVATRYTADMLPAVLFLGINYVVTKNHPSNERWLHTRGMSVLLIFSIVLTTLTALQYKAIRQSYSAPGKRVEIRRQLHDSIQPGSIIFIIGGRHVPESQYVR